MKGFIQSRLLLHMYVLTQYFQKNDSDGSRNPVIERGGESKLTLTVNVEKVLVTFFTDHCKREPVLETLSFPHKISKGIFSESMCWRFWV